MRKKADFCVDIPDIEKKKRIENEVKRLFKIYAEIDGKKLEVVDGLIKRAAFMRVMLEDFELDLAVNGFTEPFSQGNQDPYDRKRPIADMYNTMNANYQKIIKQLTDLLPKDETARSADDGFDSFINGREDV